MKITYTPKEDALYMKLNDRAKVTTRQITDTVILDFDANDKLIGIELLDASASLDDPKSIANEILGVAMERPDQDAIRAGRKAMIERKKRDEVPKK